MMKSNLTSDPLELLLGIVCLMGVIYIGPSIAAYFLLAKPQRTDLENIEEGRMQMFEDESIMIVEEIGKAKTIEEADTFEDVQHYLSEAGILMEVKSFENVEEPKKFDDDDGMFKGATTRLLEEAYTTTEHIRARDYDWELI